MDTKIIPNFKGKRILFVEPNENSRLELKVRFEKSGATVYTVGQVEKLKSLVEGAVASDQLFDIVVAEVALPGTFGFYVIKVILEALKGRRVPIFVMSGNLSSTALDQLTQWRVLGYIRKPFKISELENFILDRYIFFTERILEYQEHNKRSKNDNPEILKKVS